MQKFEYITREYSIEYLRSLKNSICTPILQWIDAIREQHLLEGKKLDVQDFFQYLRDLEDEGYIVVTNWNGLLVAIYTSSGLEFFKIHDPEMYESIRKRLI